MNQTSSASSAPRRPQTVISRLHSSTAHNLLIIHKYLKNLDLAYFKRMLRAALDYGYISFNLIDRLGEKSIDEVFEAAAEWDCTFENIPDIDSTQILIVRWLVISFGGPELLEAFYIEITWQLRFADGLLHYVFVGRDEEFLQEMSDLGYKLPDDFRDVTGLLATLTLMEKDLGCIQAMLIQQNEFNRSGGPLLSGHCPEDRNLIEEHLRLELRFIEGSQGEVKPLFFNGYVKDIGSLLESVRYGIALIEPIQSETCKDRHKRSVQGYSHGRTLRAFEELARATNEFKHQKAMKQKKRKPEYTGIAAETSRAATVALTVSQLRKSIDESEKAAGELKELIAKAEEVEKRLMGLKIDEHSKGKKVETEKFEVQAELEIKVQKETKLKFKPETKTPEPEPIALKVEVGEEAEKTEPEQIEPAEPKAADEVTESKRSSSNSWEDVIKTETVWPESTVEATESPEEVAVREFQYFGKGL